MRAVRFHGKEDVRVDDIPEPSCGPNQVKIRPAFVGICGSDLHEFLSGPLAVPVTPHPLTGDKLPTTLGHEFSGTVKETGDSVLELQSGAQVTVIPNLYDGTCPRCVSGKLHHCDKLGFIGYSGNAGGLSELVVVDQEHVVPLRASISLEIGALVEPLAVGWHAVGQYASIKANDTALVIGAGPIGLAIVQALRAQEVKSIVAVDISDKRRQFALMLGATFTLDPMQVDVARQMREISADQGGASVAFECSGVQQGLDVAIAGTRPGGTVIIVSRFKHNPTIDAFTVMLHEKHLVGAAVYEKQDFEVVIDAIDSGKLQPHPMITSKIQMEEVVDKGFRALIHGKDAHVKILVRMT